jgi:pyruvate,water dikinase
MLSTVSTFKTLDDVTPLDQPLVGGKAFNCARLRQAGIPVPDGVVIPSDAAAADIAHLATDPWFDTFPAGTLFAVRSSGLGEDSEGHSFAGIHETQLNVARDQIVEAVLVCRRSAQSDQAVAYRHAHRLGDDQARIGVLVQQMVPAVTSGVAFTVNPVTGADELVIDAAAGLGEALVSGRVTPDEYRVRKSDLSVVSTCKQSDTSDSLQTKKSDMSDLVALGELLLRIERLYGAPQDVEWCHDGRQYWIVQSRPVTTAIAKPLSPIPNPQSIPNSQSIRHPQSLRNPQSSIRDVEWTRANLAEVLPDQLSPQALDIYVDMLDRGERKFFGRLMAPERELGPIIKAFHGRLYFNLSQLRHVSMLAGAAPADLLRSFGHPEEIRPEDEIATRPPLRVLLRALPDVVRLGIKDLRAPGVLREHEERMANIHARLAAADPRALSDREIWATLTWWLAVAPDSLETVFVMSSVMMRENAVKAACRAVGFSYERLVYPQLAAGKRSVSSQQAFDLVALADVARHEARTMTYLLRNDGTFTDYRAALAGSMFLDRFDRFLAEYGHRGRYESDWAIPRMHENPAPVLFAIREQVEGTPQNARAIAERQEADAAGAWRAFEAKLSTWQKWTMLPRVRALLRRLKKQYVWREQVRSDLTRVVSRVRAWHLTLADRFAERGWIDRRDDYFLLRIAEVGRAIDDPRLGPGLGDIAARRAAELAAERDLQMPLLMRESDLPALIRRGRAASASDGRELTGLCVSPGSVEAEVVVMRDPGEFAQMKRGAILVAPATDPSWTPLFTLAAGVIVEVGGMLSHASTIAREYGLPALANVKNATKALKTGDRVQLDASAGRVVRL